MTITFNEFISQTISTPFLLVTTVLVLGVILVNGWTDAPNAVATCITTRCMSSRAAILMATVMNFVGVFVMSMLNTQVAQTIYSMVNFGDDTQKALASICAAMVAIIVFSTIAWALGIPTSESHGLIAGLSGAAIAVNAGFSGINAGEWVKVIYGLVFSSFLGFFLSFLMQKLIVRIFIDAKRQSADNFFRFAQIAGSGAMAFMHGAQDGQKFMGVFMLCVFLLKGGGVEGTFTLPLWLMIVCSVVMAVGTAIGGERIIKTVGVDMVKMQRYQGFCADMAGAVSLLISSVLGMPVSTTQTKTTAIMGAGAAKSFKSVNWGVAKQMVYTWLFTFPGCGVIGYFMALLFMRFV